MYCVKCGKRTDSLDMLCDECKAKQSGANEENIASSAEVVEEKPENAQSEAEINAQRSKERKTGLVKAIILNVIAFVQIYTFVVSLILMMFAISLETDGSTGASIGCMIVSELLFYSIIGFVVYSVVEGIKFIKLFIRHCNEKKGKPIATFVLGITLLGFALFITIYSFLVGFIYLIAPFTFLVG